MKIVEWPTKIKDLMAGINSPENPGKQNDLWTLTKL